MEAIVLAVGSPRVPQLAVDEARKKWGDTPAWRFCRKLMEAAAVMPPAQARELLRNPPLALIPPAWRKKRRMWLILTKSIRRYTFELIAGQEGWCEAEVSSAWRQPGAKLKAKGNGCR